MSHQLVAQPEYVGSDGALIDLGVDGISTRRPDVLVALMTRMGILHG